MSYDGLRGCEICGNDTTGRLCTSCAHQEMIDNDPNPPPIITLWCELCGIPITGDPSGYEYVDVCEDCAGDIRRDTLNGVFDGGAIHVHPYFIDNVG